MKVDLQKLAAAIAYFKLINSCPLGEIEWILRGKTVDVVSNEIDEWRFTGLNNTMFVMLDAATRRSRLKTLIFGAIRLPKLFIEISRTLRKS